MDDNGVEDAFGDDLVSFFQESDKDSSFSSFIMPKEFSSLTETCGEILCFIPKIFIVEF